MLVAEEGRVSAYCSRADGAPAIAESRGRQRLRVTSAMVDTLSASGYRPHRWSVRPPSHVYYVSFSRDLAVTVRDGRALDICNPRLDGIVDRDPPDRRCEQIRLNGISVTYVLHISIRILASRPASTEYMPVLFIH